MQVFGRFFQKQSDICGTARHFEPKRGTDGLTALVNEQPQTYGLRHDQCQDDQQDELTAQTVEKDAHHSSSCTSAAKQ